MAMTKEQWIEKRMAEGFSKEQAAHEYDHFHDPMVAEAQKQKVPTRGEVLQMIHEARQNNPDKKKLYSPDFSLSKQYNELIAKANKAFNNQDMKLAQKLNAQALSIQINGTISNETIQAEIDKTLDMSIADIFAEHQKYEAIITDCEEKLNNFDVSVAQAKVDELYTVYQRNLKANAGKWCTVAHLQEDYEKEVAELEKQLVTVPMNDLKIKRFEAKEYYLVYEARIKHYVNTYKALIDEEVTAAKREEIRGSLADLVEYMEGK